jgi:hypothetical protein
MEREAPKSETWDAVVEVEYPAWRFGFPKLIRRCWIPARMAVRSGALRFHHGAGCSGILETVPEGTPISHWENLRRVRRRETALCPADAFVCRDDRTIVIQLPFPDREEILFRLAPGASLTSHDVKRLWAGQP